MIANTLYEKVLPKVYINPLKKTLFLFPISLLIYPIAVIFVAIGHGLIAVNKPNTIADTIGVDVFEYKLLRNSPMH